jgi:hypothetical protein
VKRRQRLTRPVNSAAKSLFPEIEDGDIRQLSSKLFTQCRIIPQTVQVITKIHRSLVQGWIEFNLRLHPWCFVDAAVLFWGWNVKFNISLVNTPKKG